MSKDPRHTEVHVHTSQLLECGLSTKTSGSSFEDTDRPDYLLSMEPILISDETASSLHFTLFVVVPSSEETDSVRL